MQSSQQKSTSQSTRVRFFGIVLVINIVMGIIVFAIIASTDAFTVADFGNGMILIAGICLALGIAGLVGGIGDPRRAAQEPYFKPFREAEHIQRTKTILSEDRETGRSTFVYAMVCAVLAFSVGLLFNFLQ